MKMKKILAGVLAGALTVTSLTLASFADNEETSSFISVKGNTKWYAMNIDYEQTPIKKGTNTYTLSFTNENTYNDSFGVSGDDKGALEIIFADLSENLKDITLDSVSVDDEEKTIGGDTTPETKSYYWNGTDSPKVSHVITFTESQLENIGDINVGSTLKITVSATYDVSAVQIGATNFKISQEKNEEMVKGDSFTLTYDSDSIPEESRYHLKYKIPKIDEPEDDSTDYDYYNIVYNNQLNTDDAENAQAATGLKVTTATEGTKTIYTFTAVAPTSGKRPFEITAEASPKGDWSDTLYLWLGNISIMVVDSDVPAESITLAPTELSLYVGEEATLKKTVKPSDTTDEVTWESSNEDAATVEDGVVKAVGKGTATITATAGDVSATCEVTVKIAATELTLTDINVGVGKTADIVCAVGPEGAEVPEITYESSDPTIFKVVGNKVEGVKTGTATLTATATVKGETITKDCTVNVSNPATAIALDDMTVLVGQEKPIVPILTPTNADKPEITYKSSDTSIFTVTEGKIKGVAAGTAKLSAEATVNGTKLPIAECDVTVTADAKPATAVALNKATLGLEVGDKETLTVTLTPADTTDSIAWTSSNTAVATVDNGEVEALTAGEAIITAKANDDVYATCTVTVSAKTIAITSVTLNKTAATVEEGETLQLTATVNPETTTEDKTVTWSTSDETIATVDNTGKVTAVKAGEAVITATAGTKSAKCTITVTAKVSEGEGTVDPDEGLIIEVDDEDITIEADADTFEDTVTTVKAEVSVSEEVAAEKTDAIADAVKDILDGEESEVKVGAVISITLKDQDGNEIQPVNGGVVTITIPYDGESNYAAYIDGEAPEFIKLAIDEAGEYASFDAKHFSDYYLVALSDEAADAVDKENGENDNNDDDNKNKVEKTYEGSIVVNDTAWWSEFEIALDDLIGEFAPEDVKSVEFTCANHGFQIGYNGTDGDWHQVEVAAGEKKTLTDIVLIKDKYALKVGISAGDGVDYTVSWVTTALVEDDGSGDDNNDDDNKNKVEKTYEGSIVINDTAWWTEAEIPLEDLIGEFDPDDVQSVAFTCAGHGFVIGYNTADDWAQEEIAAGDTAVYTDILLKEIPAPTDDDPDAKRDYYLKVCISAGDGVDYTISWVTTALVEDDGSGDNNNDNINISFIDEPYELEVVDATGWSGGEYTKAAQVNIEIPNISGITYGTTTFGEIKNKTITLSNIVYKSCGIEGVEASDIEVCIYMLHGELGAEEWVGSVAGSMADTTITWDLSTLAAARAVVPDSSPIQAIGYQINIKGSDVEAIEAMEIGETVEVNGENDNPPAPPETTPEAPSVPEGSFTVPTTSGSSSGDNTTDTTAAPAPAPAESEQAAPSSTEEDTSTNTTSPYATKDGGDDVQPTESGTPIPDGGNGDAGSEDSADVGNAGAGNAGDKNAATGVTLALIPMIAAAAGVVISKKRK